MDWRAKALAHALFSTIPGGHRINYLAQRMVTQSLPVPAARFSDVVQSASKRLALAKRHVAKPLDQLTLYEIGAGWDLLIPLVAWCSGVQRQVLVDRRSLTTAELINDTIERLGRYRGIVDLCRRPVERIREGRVVEDLERRYGIRYIAPCDAKDTHLPTGSMDLITSTNTFEHIRAEELLPILRESRRLLAPGGALCLHIDYQDHYSFDDGSITPFNFLRYSDRAWALMNPPLHHQNRLRHRDYLLLFEAAGFELLVEEKTGATQEDIETVRAMPLDKRFQGIEPTELTTRTSTVVLRRKGESLARPQPQMRRAPMMSHQSLPME